MTAWRKPSSCDTSSCPTWRVLEDGSLELADSDHPGHVLRLSRADALALVDAARRGEVYPYGR